jgi:amino acid transporter
MDNPNAQHVLRRTLRLRDLLLYGIIVIQPTAPLPLFGVLTVQARGHAVTVILLAMIAMLFTAISYGRMAQVYPSAGSAFVYVSREVNPSLGFITGWSMVMDYLLNPMISLIWCSHAAMNFAPHLPYSVCVVFFFLLFTGLNLRGIKTSAHINEGLAILMGIVIAIFFIAAARYIFSHPHNGAGFFTLPFYDPSTFKMKSILGGTSLAVLTYIGFDGISTLSEEVENPKRNILLATVLTCLVIGILSAAEVYIAQLVWPTGQAFPEVDTAFVQVANRVGGAWFFVTMNLTLMIACIGSGMAAQLGAARLLFGMGRSNALPRSFFGAVDAKYRIPRNNVVFVGLVALGGAFLFDYSLGAEMLNFGALVAFIGVNVACFLHFFVRSKNRTVWDLLSPLLGATICLVLWLNLSRMAFIVGTVWVVAGTCYGAWRTKGFRTEMLDFSTDQAVES